MNGVPTTFVWEADMLDVASMTTAMMETMRPRTSLAEGVRMDREIQRRMAINVEGLTIMFSELLWPYGRHGFRDAPTVLTIGAAHRSAATPHNPDCSHCSYKPRHLSE